MNDELTLEEQERLKKAAALGKVSLGIVLKWFWLFTAVFLVLFSGFAGLQNVNGHAGVCFHQLISGLLVGEELLNRVKELKRIRLIGNLDVLLGSEGKREVHIHLGVHSGVLHNAEEDLRIFIVHVAF